MRARITDRELREFVFDRGPAWVREQVAKYRVRGKALDEKARARLLPFFGSDLNRVRVAVARVRNPPFYKELRRRGADPGDLPDFESGEEATTFVTAIVIRPRVVMTTRLLFHELVHVVQYRLLGVEEFVRLYADAWLKGRRRFRGDPMGRYLNIGLERNASALEKRYRKNPHAAFSVEDEVQKFLRREGK